MSKGRHLTPEERAKIIKARSYGLTYQMIAERFGFSESTVREVCHPSDRRHRRHTAVDSSGVHIDEVR